MKYLISLLIFIFLQSNSFANRIISSIKPVDSLVRMIVVNPDNVGLIIDNNQSHHGFNLKPSDLKKINEAKIIFYIDETNEIFLKKILENSKNIIKVPLLKKADVRLLNMRNANEWKSKKANYKDKIFDKHIWLDTKNAKEMLEIIKEELTKLYPINKKFYEKNYEIAVRKIDNLYEELEKQLKPVKDKKFIVFHDAFHYFEHQFNLNNIGAISVHPHGNVSIKRLKQNMVKINNQKVKCIFFEPQFNKKFTNMVAKNSGAKVLAIDAIGFNLKPSKELYLELMRNIGNSFAECLSD